MGYVYIPQPTDLLSGCACAIIFIILLFLDALKAHARKAPWFPRGFLVLSALTLQFINYVDYSVVNLTSGMKDITDEDVENFLKIQLVIDSGRLVICVFIAYLLPGLACSGFKSVWSDIGALALSVLAHIYYEILLVVYVYYNLPVSKKVTAWLAAFSATVFIAILFLVLLSISAVVAGKTIHIMMNEKVSSLVECCSDSRRDCESIQRHVLKCWIIARCSQPEYVVARSVLSSFAFLLVAVCIIVFGVKWKCVYNDDYVTLPPLSKQTLALQCTFVLAGCIVVVVRCLTALIYFPMQGCSEVEDFWTRSIIDFKYVQLKGPLFSEARYRPRTALENNIIDLKFQLLSFVSSIASHVQNRIVLLSKASFFLTSIIFRPIIFFCGSNNQVSELSHYGDLLERIKMPGEMTDSLGRANESAFLSTRRHIEEGSKSNEEMIEMIRRGREPAADGGEEIQMEEEKYFKYVGKKSWKMETVSLIHLMLSLYDRANSNVVDDAFKAFTQAWALMDFVESSDTEINLFTLAADKEFRSLEKIWKKMSSVQGERELTTRREQMRQDIQSRISKAESSPERVDTMDDSMDWTTTAANFRLHKTSQKVGYGTAQEMDNSKDLLADVIRDCWTEARKKTIIEKCNKWAVDGKERDIYHAAFILGKVMSVPAEISRDNNAVPLDVAAENGNNDAVPPDVAAENGNNATVPDGQENQPSSGDGEENEPSSGEPLEILVDTIAGEITTIVAAENDNNATVPDGEENEPSSGDGEENEP